jgi:hypothetical protein
MTGDDRFNQVYALVNSTLTQMYVIYVNAEFSDNMMFDYNQPIKPKKKKRNNSSVHLLTYGG